MSSSTTFKGIVSSSRILFGLLPGLGAMIVLRMAIHLYRPDIEDAENRVRDHPFDKLFDCYDFIIVGAGSAGSVLANRLSENPDWNVLLIEAGQDENVLSELPVLFPVLQTSSIDWQFVTEPNEGYCLSMVDGRCKWPRGKVLGGSSVLNAMLYIRGNKRDYDNWAGMGNTGWSYEDVLPYFLKSEDVKIPELVNNPFHSTGGLLTIEYFKFEQPITRKILEAARQLGYNVVDVNAEQQTGFTRSQATIRDGLRCSTAKAFLRPASKRKNIHVSVHSLVEKVLIDENKKAYGVKFTKKGQSRIIKASKEVILSAGSIQSPQLLMLSGIGDAEELKELGIYPVVHLPGVGKNLQDHVAMGGHSFLFDNPYNNGTDYGFNLNTAFSIGNLVDFAIHKNGLLYSMMEAEAMAFVNTKYQDPAEDYPDIQLFIAPTADNMDGGLFGKRANGLTDETYAELYEDILFDPSFSIVPLLLRPKSRGFLKLRDANPFSPPLIFPNYYTHEDDVKVMVEGARVVQKLVEQPALQELNARPNPHRNPGCSSHALMSDEHLECQARHHTLTIYHPVGTCAMGPAEDPGAVVDPRLRVYGIKNLRVVDASIMPTIVNGNTNAPVIMIAEKAADIIKEDWSDLDLESHCTGNSRHFSDENDEPSKIENTIPDLFNETSSLFTYLPIDGPKQRGSGNQVKPSESEINKSTTRSDQKVVKYVPKKVNRKQIVPYDPHYAAINNIPYYWPNQLQYQTPVIYRPFLTDEYPYDGSLINPYISKPKIKQRKPYKKLLPTYRPFAYNYRPYNNDGDEPTFYDTDEVITPKSQKKCRVYLYYDKRNQD